MRRRYPLMALGALAAFGCGSGTGDVANPHPVHRARPPAQPLTAVARLGRAIFYDSRLSASGRMACATCHQPDHDFAPGAASSTHLAGLRDDGGVIRAVPSLRYVDRAPGFSIGPENGVTENVDLARLAAQAAGQHRTDKLVGSTASAGAMVPQGGFFWDGRAGTLQDQAMGPLFNPAEMANRAVSAVARRLREASYASQFPTLFGSDILDTPSRLVDEAMFAVVRYQLEDSAFHPYTSKYDAYLEGRARLTAAEARGLRAFDDPGRGNCAGCHLDRPGPGGQPPTFTDYQFEALGVPRNDSTTADRDPGFFDLGLCGPIRTDLRAETHYCGLFRTPSLRNVATRTVFFHNGVYHSLDQVLTFYALRAVRPDTIYPRDADGHVRLFDDLPPAFRSNVDTVDPPFNRKPGQRPALSPGEIRDVVAFLRTLTDGYGRGH